MLILLLFACFFLLLALRVPIAFSLGIVSLGFLIARGEVLLAVSQRMSAAADSFPLLAIPFYILMGKLVNEAGLTDKIFGFAQSLVDEFKKKGMTVITPDVEAFRKASMTAIPKLEEKWGKGLYEKIAGIR